jgi:hypothetical protein
MRPAWRASSQPAEPQAPGLGGRPCTVQFATGQRRIRKEIRGPSGQALR